MERERFWSVWHVHVWCLVVQRLVLKKICYPLFRLFSVLFMLHVYPAATHAVRLFRRLISRSQTIYTNSWCIDCSACNRISTISIFILLFPYIFSFVSHVCVLFRTLRCFKFNVFFLFFFRSANRLILHHKLLSVRFISH